MLTTNIKKIYQPILSFYLSKITEEKNNLAEPLLLTLEGKLLPREINETCQEESYIGVFENTMQEFSKRIDLWEALMTDENVEWFEFNMVNHFFQGIEELPEWQLILKHINSGLQEFSNAYLKHAKIAVLRRFFSEWQKRTEQMDVQDKAQLFEYWCQYYLKGSIQQNTVLDLNELIEEKLRGFSEYVETLKESEQDNYANLQAKFFQMVAQIEDNILFRTHPDAEEVFNKRLDTYVDELKEKFSDIEEINYLLQSVCLEPDQKFMGVLLPLIQYINSCAPRGNSLQPVLAMILNGQSILTAELGGASSLSTLLPEDVLKVFAEKIKSWQPRTGEVGLKEFDKSFADYYFNPIALTYEWRSFLEKERGITGKELNIREIKANILEFMLLGLNAKQSRFDIPQEKLACFTTWVEHYSANDIEQVQREQTLNLIDATKNSLKTFYNQGIEKLPEQGQTFNFDIFIELLEENETIQIDHEGPLLIYEALNEMCLEINELRPYLEKYHPEYSLAPEQFMLYVNSGHVLKLLKEWSDSNPKKVLEAFREGSVGRLFFNFPKCDAHSECINAMFGHDKLMAVFEQKFNEWQPKTDEEGITRFIVDFVTYFTMPFELNLEWVDFFGPSGLENLLLIVRGGILFAMLSQWSEKYNKTFVTLSEKSACLAKWLYGYQNDNIQEEHSNRTQLFIENELFDFGIAVINKGEKTSKGYLINKTSEVGVKFKECIEKIRQSSIYNSDANGNHVLHDVMNSYPKVLKDLKVKKNDIKKVRAAIHADKRFSVQLDCVPKFSVLRPDTYSFYKITTAKSESKKKKLVRTKSRSEIRADEAKLQKETTPSPQRRRKLRLFNNSQSSDSSPRNSPKRRSNADQGEVAPVMQTDKPLEFK